jgi:hypothetical protein
MLFSIAGIRVARLVRDSVFPSDEPDLTEDCWVNSSCFEKTSPRAGLAGTNLNFEGYVESYTPEASP